MNYYERNELSFYMAAKTIRGRFDLGDDGDTRSPTKNIPSLCFLRRLLVIAAAMTLATILQGCTYFLSCLFFSVEP